MSMSIPTTLDFILDDNDSLFAELDGALLKESSNELCLEVEPASRGNALADIYLDNNAFFSEAFELGEYLKVESPEHVQSVEVSSSEPQLIALPSRIDDVMHFADPDADANGATSHKFDLLLSSYGLGDEQLGSMSLKKLKSLCRSTADFNHLKAYRRTCLNRQYARSSRSKQHNKTTGLAVMLEKSQEEVSRLQQENNMKDATIRCLQLELEIMRSLK